MFISYAREDAPDARRVAEALEHRGLSVFWDRTIPTGRAFEDEIEQAIASAGAVVVLWSEHSVRSDWVRAEASEGANRGILVPASLDGATPPLRYRVNQTADLKDWVTGVSSAPFEQFVNDVVAQVERTSQPILPSTDSADVQPRPRTHPDNREVTDRPLRQLLTVSILCAWLGSLALALILAFDFGAATPPAALYTASYFLTLFALGLGALLSIALGVLSLKRQFILGILQGWLWPVIAAFVEVLILVGVAQVIRGLPYVGTFEALLAFLLCGTIGPAALTVAAVVTSRRLTQHR